MNNEPNKFGMLLDVPVTMTVELGSCQMHMKDILQLDVSSLIELDTMADAPVDVLINHKKIAKGEIVVLEDRIGIRITEIHGAKLKRNPPPSAAAPTADYDQDPDGLRETNESDLAQITPEEA